MKIPSPPNPDEVEALVKDLGVVVNTMAPEPSLEVQLVTFGYLYSALCKAMGANRLYMLTYIDRTFEAESLTKEEFLERIRKERN